MASSHGLNGLNGHHDDGKRFSYIPPAIDIPLGEGEEVEVNLSELLEDPFELCTLLENEGVAKGYWEITALAYAKQNKMEHAIDILKKGLGAFSSGNANDRLSLLSALCWMYLWKCRNASRIPEGASLIEASAFYPSATQSALANGSDNKTQTKDYWLQEATRTLNDASRISPSYPPLFLARGVLSLLRASMQHPDDRAESLRQAMKSFDDALRASGGLNIMAMMGRARVQYSLGKWPEAHHTFQEVLRRAPGMSDPDPRIGIGCCLWQLGHVEDAKNAWERALEHNPDSKTAYLLLGIYYLNVSSKLNPKDPKFKATYGKAFTEFVQKAFKIDRDFPLSAATFALYYFSIGKPDNVEKLARRAIERSDVSTIASDGWYLLARVAHNQGETNRAFEFYSRADQARGGDGRGGDDRGHLPSKFGMAQIKVLQEDFVDAKFRLEKLYRLSRTTETMSLLGILYAEDYFNSPDANAKDDERTDAWKKAVTFLEQVRTAWKDPKKNATVNTDVLLTLARLYENDSPDKSLQCLQQVEQEELENMPDSKRPKDIEDEDALRSALREQLPPQLLNNMGCLHFQADRLIQARDNFQTALNACVRIASEDTDADTDALVSTISYNLARTYEAEGMNDEAKKVYEGLLERHSGYIDASARLAYIAVRENPKIPDPFAKVYHSAEDNLDVRALYGWYLSKTEKRAKDIAEDREQRFFKHTLRDFNKHDHYSMTAMGNVHLVFAREMKRETDQEKQRRRKMYEKAVEFFKKALELDEKNAYAVQGLGIAILEDKKDVSTGIQLFSQVREVLKDPSVYINLGHAFAELKQYSRAIENYESALVKDRANDINLLACLGRTWLLRAKQEKSLQGMKTSLDYSQRALDLEPRIPHFKFNLAYVRIQIAQLVYQLKGNERTSEDLQSALEGLDAAIDSLTEIAKAPEKPPFPRPDIEQRAVMCRTSVRRQLERALGEQLEYEQKNADRLAQAKEVREAEIRKREEEKRIAAEKAEAEKAKILKERLAMQERDRALAEKRAQEERMREDEQLTTDTETGERKKRVKKKGGSKRKKREADSDTEGDIDGSERGSQQRSAAVTGDESEEPKRKKKRKLERKNKGVAEKPNKYKSAEFVQDSDDEEPSAATNGNANGGPVSTPGGEDVDELLSEPEEDVEVSRPRKKANRVIDDDDEDEEPADVPMGEAAASDDE